MVVLTYLARKFIGHKQNSNLFSFSSYLSEGIGGYYRCIQEDALKRKQICCKSYLTSVHWSREIYSTQLLRWYGSENWHVPQCSNWWHWWHQLLRWLLILDFVQYECSTRQACSSHILIWIQYLSKSTKVTTNTEKAMLSMLNSIWLCAWSTPIAE